MNARNILSLVIITLMIAALCACASSSLGGPGSDVEFGSNASKVFVNTNTAGRISFSVALFSNEKITNVSYVSLRGADVNSNAMKVELMDNGTDELSGKKFEGLYVKNILVDIVPNESVKSCDFNTIVLDVDGTRRDIVFDTPIKQEFGDGGNVFSEALASFAIANNFSSRFINDSTQTPIYEFAATEDLTITGIRFESFLEPTNITCSIDGSDFQARDFPIDVKKGESVKFEFSVKSEKATSQSYVTTILYFDYVTKKDNAKSFSSAVVEYDPIYPLSDGDTSSVTTLINSLDLKK
jgi:hypothetical protein